MRSVFGLIGILVVVAAIGIIAVKQLRGTSQVAARALPAAPGAASVGAPTAGNVREQAKALGERVQGEIGRTLQEGAAGRGAETAK